MPQTASKLPPVKKSSKLRRDSTSSTPDSSSAPVSSQSRISAKSGKKLESSKSETDAASTTETEPVQLDVTPQAAMPAIQHSHRNKEKCPCNQSLGASWKLDCAKCGQFWHADCVGLKGLTEKTINGLTQWPCPFCFVSPVPTAPTEVDVCHICRNTLSLQQTNLEYEAWVAISKIKNMSKCCNLLHNVDFGQFSKNIETLMQFDTRLRHILLSENSLKGLDSEIRGLAELLKSSSSLKSSPSDTHLTSISDNLKSHDKSLQSLNKTISQLQNDILLLSTPATPISSASASESSEQFLKTISEQLDRLCANEPKVAAGISDLKQTLEKLQTNQCQNTTSTPSSSCPPVQSPPIPPFPEQHVPHGQVSVSDITSDFIQVDEAENLTHFLASHEFKSENGHSVISFGVPYEYTGSKSSSNVPPIPDQLKPIFEKVNKIQTELYQSKYSEQSHLTPPVINSCLVNRYVGPESHLPRHSDREVTIHPESSVFTLSLGQTCNIKFIERESSAESTVTCPDRSLYHMTRRSQEVFDHLIEQGSITSGDRFSLTFRAVDWRNKNSTCLLGDSNTGGLRFGSCKKGTFGELMPGQKFWSPRINDIDPTSCMGYSNVVLLCGINDVRQPVKAFSVSMVL